MNRMIFEFSRIETLEGVTRAPLNQYDSVVRPLETYLRKADVNFRENCEVTDIDFMDGPGITAKTLYLKKKVESTDDSGGEVDALAETSYVTGEARSDKSDICIIASTCVTGNTVLGSLYKPAPASEKKPISDGLWAKVASKKSGLGSPEPFFTKPEEINWLSLIAICKGDSILETIENFTGNVPGSGALMTLRDSSWLTSSVVTAQSHFVNQPANQTIFWGHGLHTGAMGDYVKKPVKDCTGQELSNEYLHCLYVPEDRVAKLTKTVVNVIPYYMPYVDAQSKPRRMSDRSPVIPAGSTSFTMASQFVEIPEDMVFIEEYSVRAARVVAYDLLDAKKRICPATLYNRQPKILLEALKKSYLQWA